jgi:gliding motility-associated protein GldL
MSAEKSKFEIWWNSPQGKQFAGSAYSLGASVVIIGAMFKIQHWTGGGLMLGIGMSVEAILFALGTFDKPFKEYQWDKVYDFDGDSTKESVSTKDSLQKNGVVSRSVGLNYTESINDDDVKKLSEGIKNLTTTAQQFAGLSEVVGATNIFVKNIDNATKATDNFIKSQEGLNGATAHLTSSYQGITEGMDTVEKNTKAYAAKVESINKNLASINSIYEIQLKNIQTQSEGLTQQNEKLRTVNDELSLIVGDVQKMKTATTIAATEADNFKTGTSKLAQQVAELNKVYGNMLNALS